MRNRKYQKLTIGGVDYSQYFHFPFMVQRALDESLDFAVLELSNTRVKDPFKPFQTVVIGSGDTALTFITAQDEVEEKFGTGLYKHTLTVMEKTKETERIICGAKAFTNPLVRDYTDGQTLINGWVYEEYGVSGNEYMITSEIPVTAVNFRSPINVTSLPIYIDNFGMDFGTPTSITVKIAFKDDGKSPMEFAGDGFYVEESLIKYNKTFTIASDDFVIDYYDVPQTGIYGFLYETTYDPDTKRNVYFEVYVVDEPVTKAPYTLEDVTLQLLDTCETLRVGLNKPRYQLRYRSTEQMGKFKQPAPEFRFSNGRSLFENLREIGRYVHAIPRIEHDTLTNFDYLFFDELGGTEYADLSKGGQRFGGTASFNVGDYTGGLEAMASNLVNLDDEAEGSITEPFAGGYISMRAATEEARIQEGTGFIKTTYPIEKIIKVEIGQFGANGVKYSGGDITPYIFEKAEYDILSSYTGSYPTSKTYALYYTQGSPNIQGLWYKAQDSASDIINAAENYSLTNVLELAIGINVGFFELLKRKFSNDKEKWLQYPNLIFRITYIPSVTARVRQYKPTYDGSFPSVMVHNQSANKLSSKAFGENLRGQLAMMSNVSKTVMYLFQRLEDVPKPGTLYDDDYYIASVATRVWHDYVIAQIGLSKGYNELGGYVEINNAIRQFEIPDAEDRYTVLEEFCYIGTQSVDDENLALTASLRSAVLQSFESQNNGRDATLAIINTYDEYGNGIQGVDEIALPVISLAVGDSLYFGFRFEDNFGAGSKSATGGTTTNPLYPEGTGFRSQEYVRYADQFYSQAHSVGFRILSNVVISEDLESRIANAHALPEAPSSLSGISLVDTGDHPILWHKDSADAGCITYQLHFMTNDGLIIGDGLAHHCAAVRTVPSSEEAYIYFYNHRINQLTGTTDTENFLNVYTVKVDLENRRIYYTGTPSGFKSWAIIKGGRFMLGNNTTERPINIYFNFKRRISE